MIIVGAGGYGCELAAVARAAGHDVVGFVDDGEPDLERLRSLGLTLLGGLADAAQHANRFVIGVGYPKPRRALADRMVAAGLTAAEAIVHPSAVLLGAVELAPGCVVMPNSTVSNGARLSPHVLVNYQASVGHDTVIGPATTIGPNVAVGGTCRIGSDVLVGSGAVILQGLSVGDQAVIGSGAAVIGDVPAGMRALGVPATLSVPSS